MRSLRVEPLTPKASGFRDGPQSRALATFLPRPHDRACSCSLRSLAFYAMAKVTIGVRVEEETERRIDIIAAELSRRAAGVEAKRGEVARAALEKGVTVLERELGIEREAAPAKSASTAKKGTRRPAPKPAK